ncbi:MAG: GH92 family glycosyl hydrolase [Pontiellaceae bacterium]|nr:GH92 family glycosyl hydrolase [Pontiellaceae bacterium]MBN2785630.1 GH92 family glycosyl hydrolase [Pontiellaceae bacterium]
MKAGRYIMAVWLGVGLQCVGGPELVSYVNTLQGTESKGDYSHGNTYPTIAVPYPMHSYSAQTGKNGHGWKYQYPSKTIRGFQQVHQCSPWVNDYNVFSLFPEVGELAVDEETRASAFSHDNETAKPHYYSVKFDNGIQTEISPTERCGHMRFTFPGGDPAWLVLDGYTGDSHIQIHPDHRRITGWVHNGGWLTPGSLKSHFILEFDQPFTAYGTWENRTGTVQAGNKEAEGKGAGAFLQFEPGSTVQVKVCASYISPEQAEVTFQREIAADQTLDETKAKAARLWNELLGRVRVEGKSEADKATFYSCLFRANLFSHKFYEIRSDGSPYYFSPFDEKIHNGYMYTDNGFWDTFRSQFPLTNILHPTMQGRYMQALLDAQEQCGWYPSWCCPGNSGIMIGNHAISLLTDAWAKGIRTFDPEQALAAYKHEITNKSPWGGSCGREAHKEYFELGYIPFERVGEATAKTLEYAYDDWCAYHLACMTANKEYEEFFGKLIYHYKNVWDPAVGFMRGRMPDGCWRPDFDPYEWGGPFTEGNSWQYTWSVFHDIRGLIHLVGSEEAFVAKLDELFAGSNEYRVGSYGTVIHEISEMLDAGMGQYAHGNQPVQHVAYLYNYARRPWKTQYQVREIMSRLYNASEKGYPGDEDQGGLSSWYVLSALGIYSVCPGSDQYVIGSPMFEKASITLESGKVFTIEAVGNSPENVYIQTATLNGHPLTRSWISYDEIMQGGVLKFTMGSIPNKARGTGDADLPFSVSEP